MKKLDAAADLYRRHGAGERWLETLQADRLHAAGSPALPAKSTRELPQSGADRKPGEDSSPTGVFRKQGEYWTFSWTGSESRLKERRGFHYIAWMLRHPGREFAASDLVSLMEAASLPLSDVGGPATGPEIVTVNHGLGDAGPRLDFRAKTQYKRRLEDLREELELAERLNDPGRAERARGEIEFIQDEIGAATGLGGRSRKNSSHAERARLAVTKTVKAALERIRQADPELGRHLTLSIRTGNFCAYLPEQPVPWLL